MLQYRCFWQRSVKHCCTGWPKSPYTMFDRPLPETFLLEHYYFSMVTDAITPEKYASAVKIFLACIFLVKIEKNCFFSWFFSFRTNICVFAFALSVHHIPCILLHHSSYHSPPEFISMKTQNLVCDSSARFLGTTGYQPNVPEFADFTADLRKP